MAADEAIAELAAQLSVEETPVKLRCATCSQIAYNALRLPCCEQNICETCYNELEDMCQVCHHEPLDKSLCTPNKALRTTTKVFLKKKLLERSKDQRKKDGDAANIQNANKGEESARKEHQQAPATALENRMSTTQGLSAVDSIGSQSTSTYAAQSLTPGMTKEPVPQQKSYEPQMDVPHQSIEFGNENQNSASHLQSTRLENTSERPPTRGSEQMGKPGESLPNGQWNGPGMHDMMNGTAGMNGMGGMNNGMSSINGMSGMDSMNGSFPMDFNAMMPMGGLPNMMGMGMDPVMMNQMSQSMFGGFGGPNMGIGGMNGMSMGMGLSEQGQFGGPWMAGQDTFNTNSHGNGNFGGQGGYNMPSHQGNFNQMNHQQYAHNDYQNGYGRPNFQGRGGRGRRGGFHSGPYGRNHQGQPYQGNHNGYANHDVSNHTSYNHNQQTGAKPGILNTNPAKDTKENRPSDQIAEYDPKEYVPGDENSGENTAKPTAPVPHDASIGETENQDTGPNGSSSLAPEAATKIRDKEQAEDKPLPIQTFISDEPRSGRSMPPPRANVPLGPSSQYQPPRPFQRGNGYSTSDSAQSAQVSMNISVVPSTEPKGVGVVGAPTGPKALRVGLPNTGRSGIVVTNRSNIAAPAASPAAPPAAAENKNHVISHVVEKQKPTSKSRSRSRTRSRTRSRSRSPSHHQSEHNQSRRQRSRSTSSKNQTEQQGDGFQEQDRKRSKHYESDQAREEDASSRRSSQRHHQRHAKETELVTHRRHRDRSHDHDSEKGRGYDYDQEYDRDHNHSREKGRERDRDRDRDRDERRRRHRRSRSRTLESMNPTATFTHAPDMPANDEGSRKRRAREQEEVDSYPRDHDYERHERKRSRRDPHSKYHASSRETSKPATPVSPSFSSSRRESLSTNNFAPPTGPSAKAIPTGPRADAMKHKDRDGFRIQGRDRERQNKEAASGSSIARSSEKDAHTLEREARDRERLLKEMQRRATMEAPKRKSSGATTSLRRSSVKYEDEDGEDAFRVEREREGQRWR